MKILFVCRGDQPDYQCDSLYHGFKNLIGRDLESTADLWYMYKTLNNEDRKYLYGKGFTLYGLLNNGLKNVPKPQKVIFNIQTHYYDYVIFGTIIKDETLLALVLRKYLPHEIAFIDGEDGNYINKKLLGKGRYFKRELNKEEKNIYPISFGIPAEKIVKAVPVKLRDWAINYPGKLDTYIFDNEDAYYADYQSSRFAVTTKKEGWDCLRHYEILANGCIPFFKDIGSCPDATMVNFPKEILKEIYHKIDGREVITSDEYGGYIQKLIDIAKENLTTEAIVKLMLNTLAGKPTNMHKTKAENTFDKDLTGWNFKIDKILELAVPEHRKDAVLIYSGVSSVQDIRFLTERYRLIYATDTFESAVMSLKNVLGTDVEKVKFIHDILFVNEPADTIILDFTLPYQENVFDYLLKVKSLMKLNSRLILIVPNFQTIINLFAFIKSDFRFGKIKLSKTPPVNFYSKKAIYRLLASFGLKVNEVSSYDFENNHFFKRIFNKIALLKFWNSKMLIFEASLNEE